MQDDGRIWTTLGLLGLAGVAAARGGSGALRRPAPVNTTLLRQIGCHPGAPDGIFESTVDDDFFQRVIEGVLRRAPPRGSGALRRPAMPSGVAWKEGESVTSLARMGQICDFIANHQRPPYPVWPGSAVILDVADEATARQICQDLYERLIGCRVITRHLRYRDLSGDRKHLHDQTLLVQIQPGAPEPVPPLGRLVRFIDPNWPVVPIHGRNVDIEKLTQSSPVIDGPTFRWMGA